MAKKKASAKKASVKKTAPKKTAAKKTVKKAAPKAKPTKKTASKKVEKKAVTKKVAKTTAKKPAAKAVVKKSAVKKSVAKKAAAKKTVAKKAAKPTAKAKTAPTKAPAAKVVTSHLVRDVKAPKVVDLSDFVTPLDDRLIVQVSAAERMTAGGLYIPDTVADASGNLQGVVVSVGRGHISKKGHLRPMDVKVGDSIVFAQYAGTKINLQNEDLIILRESDVMGVIGK